MRSNLGEYTADLDPSWLRPAVNQDAARTRTIQVKTLSKGSPVPLSNKLDHLFADFVVVCRYVIRETPECFILTPGEVRQLAHRGEKNGKVSFWLQPRDYAKDEFREKWERIGSGLAPELVAAEGDAEQK